jgi:hypothetical protein
MLSAERFPVLLDAEPQWRGEDEVSCGVRLMGRLFRDYPRAFDIVVADGLYLKAPFFHLLLSHSKNLIVVLKDERRELLQDAAGLFGSLPFVLEQEGNVCRQIWEVEGLESWDALGTPVRVVRSVETQTVRRQLMHRFKLNAPVHPSSMPPSNHIFDQSCGIAVLRFLELTRRLRI